MDNQKNVPMIELRHVEKHYGDLHVLRDINLSVRKGEVVVIIGPSGSGKSTLCRSINRLEPIDSGEILLEEEQIPQEGKKLAELRAQIGIAIIVTQTSHSMSLMAAYTKKMICQTRQNIIQYSPAVTPTAYRPIPVKK